MKNMKRSDDGRWIVDSSEVVAGEFIERKVNGKTYVCQKRKRTRATFRTKTEAEAHLDLIRGRRAMRKAGFEPPAEVEDKAEDVAFGVYARRIAATKTDLRPNSREALDKVIRALEPVFGERPLRAITADDIASHIASRGATPTAANEERRVIRMVMRRAVEEGLIAKSPAGPAKRLRHDSRRLRFLSDQEADLLLAAASPTMATFIRLLLTTAVRPCEALAAHWAWDGWDTEAKLEKAVVDPDRKILHIPSRLAKNHRLREIPVSTELLAVLKATSPIEPGRKIFLWRGETPHSFGTAVKAAKLRNVSPYTCRHSAISRMIKAGIDIVTVAEIAGHSDIKMTARYAHSDNQSKRDAIDRLTRIYVKPEKPADQPAQAAASAEDTASAREN